VLFAHAGNLIQTNARAFFAAAQRHFPRRGPPPRLAFVTLSGMFRYFASRIAQASVFVGQPNGIAATSQGGEETQGPLTDFLPCA
jgi:hypothetical protein